MKGTIYGVRNKVNGRWYVGQTKHNLIWRREWHKIEALSEKLRNNMPFHRAIRKWGWENFEWHVLEKNPKNLTKAEQKWIDLKNSMAPNGYNVQLASGSNINDCKKVIRSDGKIYNSLTDAAKEFSDNPNSKSNIWWAINKPNRSGSRRTAFGYYWEYFEEV